jgi:3-oxoadipate enol-lactonase
LHALINNANIWFVEHGPATGPPAAMPPAAMPPAAMPPTAMPPAALPPAALPPAALPLVFIHGFPFSHEMWIGQIEAFGKEYRTIAYDVRGHGRSDVGDGQYTIEGHVDDLIGLLDLCHIDRAVVVGLSMGGYILLRALERNPERFRAAVLCDTRSEADPNDARIRRAVTAAAVKNTGAEAFAAEFVKSVFAADSLKTRADAVEKIRSVIAHTSPLSIAGTLIALAARTDTTPSLDKIRIPVLILVGEHDAITPPSAARAMHEHIKGSTLQIIPAAAHMSNLENPGAFTAALQTFLRTACK